MDIIPDIIYIKVDNIIEYLLNILENCITIHLMIICSDFNNTINFIYHNFFISEHYHTIYETNSIKYMETSETTYLSIKTSELYISFNDTDIFVYGSIIVVELYDIIQETRPIIYLETIGSLYVIILTSEADHIIMETEETSEDIIVDIIYSRT